MIFPEFETVAAPKYLYSLRFRLILGIDVIKYKSSFIIARYQMSKCEGKETNAKTVEERLEVLEHNKEAIRLKRIVQALNRNG